MKKLALASVAFAGVLAYGAGDAFAVTPAVGFVGYNNNGSSVPGQIFSSTDYTLFSPLGVAATTSAAGGTAGVYYHSHKGVQIEAMMGATTTSGFPELSVLKQYNGATTANTVRAGFPPGTNVLATNGRFSTSGGSAPGPILLSFSTQGLSSIGFDVSPAAAVDWDATITVLTATSMGFSLLGTVTISNARYCFGTSVGPTACPAQFFGASDHQKPIDLVIVGLSSTGPLAIGPFMETKFGSKPPPGIPEPASLSILGAGLLGLGALRLRRRGRDPGDGSRWSPFGRWRVAEHPPDSKHLLR